MFMDGYVYGLILVGVSAAVVEWLSVGGEGGRMKSHLRLVTGLCLMMACFYPLRVGVTYLKSLADGDISLEIPVEEGEMGKYESVLEGYLTDAGETQVRAWVSETLTAVFGVAQEHQTVEVLMTVSQGSPCPSEIYISLSGKAILKDPHQIEAYISSRMACPCYVSVS